MKKIIISTHGKVETHIATAGNYVTLCGLDGDDNAPEVRQKIIPYEKEHEKRKIDCKDCKAIWMVCQKYNRKDFKWR